MMARLHQATSAAVSMTQRIPRPAPPYSFRSVEFIEVWLARKGVARLATESRTDAFARSLGITSIELRTYLQPRGRPVCASNSYRYLVAAFTVPPSARVHRIPLPILAR